MTLPDFIGAVIGATLMIAIVAPIPIAIWVATRQ